MSRRALGAWATQAGNSPLWMTYLILLVTTLVWGGTNVVAKISLSMAPVGGLAATRFAIAAVCFTLLLAATERSAFSLTWSDLPLLCLLGLTGITGSNLFFFYGLSLAPVADAALITPSMNPLWTAAFAALLLGERFSRRQLGGMAVSLLGVVLIVGAAGIDPQGGSDRLIGDVLLLAGSACWAVYTVLGRRALRRHSALAASTFASLIGTAPMLLVAAPDGGEWLRQAPMDLWLAILYLALFGTVAAFLAWYHAIRVLGAARAGQFTYLVPVWALLLAGIFLGERPAPLQLVGAALVAVGLGVANRAAGSAPAPVEARP